MKTEDKTCRWMYRPGENGGHWSMALCDHEFRYLSRIRDETPQGPGCADYYNGKLCPGCGLPVKMDYTLVEGY